ncbi:ATPase, AAA family [Streptomyces ipomoeae 91-03]|uniref:ATPase, AAA family n=1 Tax=Streptomyces ipomoeae 91-03 TaxID=698759 RepID=L1KXL8_9ACTN|nr:ATPase, AAA family [Streptomyces ipomoeae 91-03]
MQAAVTVTPSRIPELLLNLATVRPVFVWGAPGIGKSSLVRDFAQSLGLECVSLLGTQLAPEDLIGVPQIRDGRSVFCPPEAIARDEPYCLFLDELNAATPDVQKAFYSLILDRRIGNYELPKGSIVIGAGNRATDNALARPIASALVNRLTHVHLEASAKDWLAWAADSGIHPWILDHLTDRPDHLWSKPPKTEEPFSTPRSWHMLSDALHSFGRDLDEETLRVLAHGTLTPAHAVVFCDVAPHDAGFLPPTEIAGRVRVHGRGGTALQPGIDLLHRADDFPPGAPILVITDGWCDALRVRREHAYLIPQGGRLPFTPRGPVFRVR